MVMGEPTHEVIQEADGVRRNGTLKTLVTVIVSITTVIASGWIGWTSHKNVDHESRISVIESAYHTIREDVKAAKVTIEKSALDLAGIQVLLQDIRDDQKRRQKKENRGLGG
jgi:hypothetical protein